MNNPFLSGFSSLLVILLPFSLHAQDKTFSVGGRITDEKTGAPMAGASVFCQNTTIGVISKPDGTFYLRLANGGYDMVISYTGYATQSIRISKDLKDKDSLIILMKEEDKTLSAAVVSGSFEVANGWDKYGQFFLDHFIGTTPSAAKCTLENKDSLKFYFYKKRNKLRVKAVSDLIVTNMALGYRIRYQLDSFVYDYNTNISSYTGYPFFEELQGTPEQQQIWKDNRSYAYTGSRLHFLRSWYDSTLDDEGYVLEMVDSNNANRFTTLKNPYDPRIYSVDSGDVVIALHGRLRVSFTNQAPSRKYLEENKFPLTTRAEISAIDISDSFVIQVNGYFYDQSDVTNLGYWAWKKLAELLPYDYNPE
jgi:hypothetical protein